MDIWIIRNGERYGPFHDYDIRRKIDADELSAEDIAWHEGLPEWIPVSKIAIFENEFKNKQSVIAPAPVEALPEVGKALASPPPIPEKPKLIRRFWARWLDIFTYVGLWWLALYFTNRNIGNILVNQWIILTQLVPWLIIEILLIHRFATTPGKWLLGMRVLNADGTKLSLAESTRRAGRVFLIGIGLGWPYVSVFCQALSAFTTHRIGAPLWDHMGKHRVTYKPFSSWKIGLFVMLFFVAIQAQLAVVSPYVSEYLIKQMPEMKQYFKTESQWVLPPRHK
jgi:uncharacterized RDD family membrane protein YckC